MKDDREVRQARGLFTEDQVAEMLLISKRVLRGLCKKRQIGFVRVSPRRRVFTQRHIDKFIQKRAIEPKGRPVDKNAPESVPFPRKGGEKAPTRLQGGSEEDFFAIRKEIATLWS